MDDNQEKYILGDSNISNSKSINDEEGLLFEQPTTPTLAVQGILIMRSVNDPYYTMSLHWTVRPRRLDMNSRTASILLKVMFVEFLLQGIDFSGYMAVEFLVSYLLRSHTDPLEIREEKDRQSVLLGILILQSIRSSWIDLEERIKLPPSIIQEIIDLKWLPNQRTYNSWKQYHHPRQHLEILAVPLENYDNRNNFTEPYSSYTKHYGIGGHRSRIQKTPYDSEIDGEITDQEPPVFTLLEVEQYNRILLSIERQKIERNSSRER